MRAAPTVCCSAVGDRICIIMSPTESSPWIPLSSSTATTEAMRFQKVLPAWWTRLPSSVNSWTA